MSDRRDFVKKSLLSSAALLTARSAFAHSPEVSDKHYNTTTGAPIVISTWDFGKEANAEAWKMLSKNSRAVDAVESGVRVPEADATNQTVGRGGRPDRDGRVTLDASIMDDKGNCGSVACLEHVVHAISVARMVMDRTPHVMLAGEGAFRFAMDNGFKKENLLTEQSEQEWKEWLKEHKYTPQANIENKMPAGPGNHDTIGMLAMDTHGNMGGACTTSGMAYKMRGRIGDSPIIGAGLFVDNEVGAATSSGLGEEVIRTVGSHLVVESMRLGMSPEAACRRAIERIAAHHPDKPEEIQVGFLALNKHGEFGAFALRDGFTYAVRSHKEEKIYSAPFLWK